ncbi:MULTISPECIES: hypothetical protein [Prochlorococcus]|nr:MULTISPECIES: hypothetical protein [Prochlorococcus]KGG14176.1 hypothetical protein EV05_0065 [Prochlorococcus sp. MIT 0601]
MNHLLKRIKSLILTLVARGKEAEHRKAGKKWDSIVEELRNRK